MKKLFTLMTLLLCAVGVNATITAKWDFTSAASPRVSVVYQSSSISAGSVASDVTDINMWVDATTGKFDTQNRTGDAQVINGTVLYIPVSSTEDQIVVTGNWKVSYTIGQEITTVTDLSKTYNVQADDVALGYVKITVTSNDNYFYSIVATLAYKPGYLAIWDFSNDGDDVKTVAGFSGSSSDQTITKNGVVMTVNAGGSYIATNHNSLYTGGAVSFKVGVNSTNDIIYVVGYPGNCSYSISGSNYTETTTKHNVTSAEVADGYVEIINGAGQYIVAIAVIQAPTNVVTIATSGYSTYSSNNVLDFSNISDFAYKVTTVTASAAALEEVTSAVAAGTGLILVGTAGETYSIPGADTGTDISSTNKLKATGSAGAAVAANEAYIMNGGQFKLLTAAGTIPANKAYLLASDISGARGFDLDLDFGGGVTGISEIENVRSQKDDIYYDLNGRRVLYPTKGLYIVNGKKVVMK